MDCQVSRREMLRFMAFVLPATLFGNHPTDYFDEELVCVHVYDPVQDLPSPLLEAHRKIKTRNENQLYFQMGMPELVVCGTKISFLDMFQYFWPVSRQEISRLQSAIKVHYKIPEIHSIDEIKNLEIQLNTRNSDHPLAVILTLNNYTRFISQRLVEVCKRCDIDELVLFKDPSQPPYLCSYPSRQKGFKKPPPIGGIFKTRAFT